MNTRLPSFKELCVHEDLLFSDALKVMGAGGYQLALAVDSVGTLKGVITDSDVRKALVRGCKLDQPIRDIMNKAPLIASDSLSDSEARQLMLLNHIFHIPMVGTDGKLVGIHVAEQLVYGRLHSEKFVIMAGGRGKRLMPLTEDLPKPMLPVNGRPMLEMVIEKAKSDGFREIVLSINYLGEIIKDHFEAGDKLGVNISYIEEDKPLGTAGSLKVLDISTEEYALISNADVVTDISFDTLLAEAKRIGVDGMMVVKIQDLQNPFGVVHTNGNKLIGIEEKPVYRNQINAGIYVISGRLLRLLDDDTYCDMTELFKRGISNGFDLRVFPIHESWIDVGRHDDYERVQMQ